MLCDWGLGRGLGWGIKQETMQCNAQCNVHVIILSQPRRNWSCGVCCRPFNKLWPNYAKWGHGTYSIFVQAITFCMTVPNQYVDQYWLISHDVIWHSSDSNIKGHAKKGKPFKRDSSLHDTSWNYIFTTTSFRVSDSIEMDTFHIQSSVY